MLPHLRYGEGPTRAILIHGWFGDMHDFDMMLTAVDPAEFSVASIEFRGYGEAKDREGPFDIETIATDVLTLADDLGWDEFAVVGHSMGGKAALRVAANAPGRVKRLCGISPVWAGRSPFDEERLATMRGAPTNPAVRQGVIHGTTGARHPAFWSRNIAERSVEQARGEAVGDYFESWALGDFAAEVEELETETLVVVGAHDPGLNEAAMKATWLANLPNARLEVLSDAGHYPIFEAPVSLAGHLTRFLSPES